MKFAFAYLRVSTEEQTVQNQRLALEKWAQNQNYQILDFFEDSAVSGKIPAINRKYLLSIARGSAICSIWLRRLLSMQY
jgi:putative DNA-invertase from lambdoid prophage Rac